MSGSHLSKDFFELMCAAASHRLGVRSDAQTAAPTAAKRAQSPAVCARSASIEHQRF
jgi:hypothetical protein